MRRHRDLLAILRANGMRITSGRRALLQLVLDRQGRDLALGDIHAQLARMLGRVDRTSVYRNLLAFERLGILQRLRIAGRGTCYRYALERELQRYYICRACGHAVRAPRALFDRIDSALRATRGFREANLSLVFYGTCPACTRPRHSARKASNGSRRDARVAA